MLPSINTNAPVEVSSVQINMNKSYVNVKSKVSFKVKMNSGDVGLLKVLKYQVSRLFRKWYRFYTMS